MAQLSMRVMDMDYSIFLRSVDGCKYAVKEEQKEGTYLEGNSRGIDDTLGLVDERKQDLTFMMKMAILGLRHQHDDNKLPFYVTPSVVSYFSGYDNGMNNTVKILTGIGIKPSF